VKVYEQEEEEEATAFVGLLQGAVGKFLWRHA